MPENPWLEVSLVDYEGHMALPQVAQTQLLGDLFADLLRRFTPVSVAIAGCAGGNGFDRIDPVAVERVIGIDINREFLEAAKMRYRGRFRSMDLISADIERDTIAIEPVDLVYAALLLEYTNPAAAFDRLRNLTGPDGHIAIVSQLPSASIPEITPSPYPRLGVLAKSFHFVDTAALAHTAAASGCEEIESRVVKSAGGKEFRLQVFRARHA